MFQYFLYGSHVISDMPFFQLLSYEDTMRCTQPDIYIRGGDEIEFHTFEQQSYIQFGEQETIVAGDSCILKICERERILYWCKDDAARSWLPHFILGVGIALLLYQRDQIAVHGSCIYNEQGAVLICGESGAGKSTTTVMLMNKGYHFMADDITLIASSQDGQVCAYAAFPYQKLCKEVALDKEVPLEKLVCLPGENSKYMVPYQGKFPTSPIPVRTVIILTLCKDKQMHVEEIKGVQKVYACKDIMFLSTILGKGLHTVQQGHAIMEIASRIPIYHITRPYQEDTKTDVENAIVNILSGSLE